MVFCAEDFIILLPPSADKKLSLILLVLDGYWYAILSQVNFKPIPHEQN